MTDRTGGERLPRHGDDYHRVHLTRCKSTNTILKTHFRKWLPRFPLLLTADEQRHGRGRHDRSWYSARGLGVYASFGFVFAPETRLDLLPLTTGLVVAEALSTRIQNGIRLKWPNDVLVHGAKISGILIENIVEGRWAVSICGIGINVNHSADDLAVMPRHAATSIKMSTGMNTPTAEVVRDLARLYPRWLDLLQSGAAAAIIERVNALSYFRPGDPVRLQLDDRRIQGLYQGIDGNGGLCLLHEDGSTRTYINGEILRPLQSSSNTFNQ